MSEKPFFPEATAYWLVKNTSLTFQQIADFVGFHIFKIMSMEDGSLSKQIQGVNPIENGQLTQEEISRCEKDSEAKLEIQYKPSVDKKKSKKSSYVPFAKRQDKPSAVLWIVNTHPDFSNAQIQKLIGVTKSLVESIRDRSYANIASLSPKSPILLDLCSKEELSKILDANAKKNQKKK